MILNSPAGRLLDAFVYTIWMSQNAMRAKALGATDARVCEYVQEWSRGLRGRAGIEVRGHGLDAVDWSRTYVIMANHASYLDVLALYSTLPRIVGFVAKKELYVIPFFNGVMRAIGCVPVNRGERHEAVEALREAADAVRGGTTIAIFPEGTRSPGDRILPMKKGPFHLVQMAQVEVLPIGIRGAAALMPRQNTSMHSGVIEVHAGAPLPPCAPDDIDARLSLMRRVREELSRLAALPMMG
jgi:1-acyl-sn-glycerol-3-phosphate acyltransferase